MDRPPEANGPPRGPQAFANLFHLISRALTEYRHVLTVAPGTPAREAVRLLREHRFSQVPVVEHGHVAGLFSYRSYALAVVDAFDTPGRHRTDGLSVWECIETAAYVQSGDEFHRLLADLDARDAVLVGSGDRCEGIITAMGVVRHLFEAGSPFLMVAEIELCLRALIEAAVTPDEWPGLVGGSLPHYSTGGPPALRDLCFNDYVVLIGHGDNWDRFADLFAADRTRTRAWLEQARDLRNDLFHHRRPFGPRDSETLAEFRRRVLRLMSRLGEIPPPAVRL